jgi:hypothetical protein
MTSFNNQLLSKILVPIDGLEYPFRTDQKLLLLTSLTNLIPKQYFIYFTLLVLQEEIYLLHFVTSKQIDIMIKKYKRRI